MSSRYIFHRHARIPRRSHPQRGESSSKPRASRGRSLLRWPRGCATQASVMSRAPLAPCSRCGTTSTRQNRCGTGTRNLGEVDDLRVWPLSSE
eukprot:scaffold9967_cov64-Phaeocystis_antarctica.AAC.3